MSVSTVQYKNGRIVYGLPWADILWDGHHRQQTNFVQHPNLASLTSLPEPITLHDGVSAIHVENSDPMYDANVTVYIYETIGLDPFVTDRTVIVKLAYKDGFTVAISPYYSTMKPSQTSQEFILSDQKYNPLFYGLCSHPDSMNILEKIAQTIRIAASNPNKFEDRRTDTTDFTSIVDAATRGFANLETFNDFMYNKPSFHTTETIIFVLGAGFDLSTDIEWVNTFYIYPPIREVWESLYRLKICGYGAKEIGELVAKIDFLDYAAKKPLVDADIHPNNRSDRRPSIITAIDRWKTYFQDLHKIVDVFNAGFTIKEIDMMIEKSGIDWDIINTVRQLK